MTATFRLPVTLEGHWVRLVPLDARDAGALRAAARDPQIGRYMLMGPGTTPEETTDFIATILERQRAGTDLGFTTVLRAEGRAVGMTRFLHIDRENHSVEIGGTWLDSSLWKTPVNTESKYLLLRHAFETERVHRVSIQTDLRNERAQRAIERLGAVREAEFRDDKLLSDGSFRTSVVYGIVASEWLTVKQNLEAKLARPWEPPQRSTGPDRRGRDARR
ncbi:MAG: GNAT family N-acetyltransferase [Candidatus Lutacidiplasmatales archaeon]